MNKVVVIGAGSWGTALACLLAEKGGEVCLLGRDTTSIEQMNKSRCNEKYLPGISFPDSLKTSTSFQELQGAQAIFFVIPSKFLRKISEELTLWITNSKTILLSCTKGIEKTTGARMTQILQEHYPNHPIAVLSGPNHAEEIACRLPAATVIGCREEKTARMLQQLCSNSWFRAYTSTDVAGIEFGGAIKNVFAIAAGIIEGLQLGDNAKAALVTRGSLEMIRLGCALGGSSETFYGLSGIGDLIATCYSPHSRNHKVGKLLGQGQSLEDILDGMSMVAEGVPNTENIYQHARRIEVETPIIDQIYGILYEGRSPKESVKNLLSREPKAEISY